MLQTAVVAARVPAQDAEQFAQLAARRGLTRSFALGMLITGALAFDRQAVDEEACKGSSTRGGFQEVDA